MASASASVRAIASASVASQLVAPLNLYHVKRTTLAIPCYQSRRLPHSLSSSTIFIPLAVSKRNSETIPVEKVRKFKGTNEKGETEVEAEELPWVRDKALHLVEFTGSVTQALPGPRVGTSSLPWVLAIPLAYAGVTLGIAIVKTVQKFTSPTAKRRKLVGKNALLCKSIDGLFQMGRDEVKPDDFKGLEKQTGFSMEEILRKYIRYALNEKPFNPELVANLIHLRKASMLRDSAVAQILNEVARRIVRDKGPVIMDPSGYTERGFKRKLAIQALFGKLFYLSELPEFCSRDSSLIVKEIFGVTDEDADELRIHTLSEAGDMASLEKMVDDSDAEDSHEG